MNWPDSLLRFVQCFSPITSPGTTGAPEQLSKVRPAKESSVWSQRTWEAPGHDDSRGPSTRGVNISAHVRARESKVLRVMVKA